MSNVYIDTDGTEWILRHVSYPDAKTKPCLMCGKPITWGWSPISDGKPKFLCVQHVTQETP